VPRRFNRWSVTCRGDCVAAIAASHEDAAQGRAGSAQAHRADGRRGPLFLRWPRRGRSTGCTERISLTVLFIDSSLSTTRCGKDFMSPIEILRLAFISAAPAVARTSSRRGRGCQPGATSPSAPRCAWMRPTPRLRAPFRSTVVPGTAPASSVGQTGGSTSTSRATSVSTLLKAHRRGHA